MEQMPEGLKEDWNNLPWQGYLDDGIICTKHYIGEITTNCTNINWMHNMVAWNIDRINTGVYNEVHHIVELVQIWTG